MASVIFDSLKRDVMSGAVDLANHAILVLLVTSAYIADLKNHAKRSDITNEVSGTGYTAGGQALTGKSATADTTNDRGTFTADDLTWANSTITARGAVLYRSRGGAANADELVCYFDFGADKSSSAGSFSIAWNASGILLLT